jgi:hypothetical protein
MKVVCFSVFLALLSTECSSQIKPEYQASFGLSKFDVKKSDNTLGHSTIVILLNDTTLKEEFNFTEKNNFVPSGMVGINFFKPLSNTLLLGTGFQIRHFGSYRYLNYFNDSSTSALISNERLNYLSIGIPLTLSKEISKLKFRFGLVGCFSIINYGKYITKGEINGYPIDLSFSSTDKKPINLSIGGIFAMGYSLNKNTSILIETNYNINNRFKNNYSFGVFQLLIGVVYQINTKE